MVLEGIKNIYDLDNYNLVSNCRKRKKGGGVALYLDKALQFRVRKNLNIISDVLESIFIEIDKSVMQTKENVIIGTIYRPPNTDMDQFLEQMTTILETVRKEKKLCYIMGDFNINLLNIQRHKPSNDFYNLMESFYLFPLIIKPTRITEFSATLIDNIFTNNINTRKSLSGLFLTDISDHFPIFTILEIKDDTQKHNKYTYVTGRNFSEQNIENFQDNLNAIDWSFINNHNTQGAFSLFHSTVMSVYNDCFPNRTVKLNKYQSNKRWLTVGLKAPIKKKNKLYIKYKRHPSIENKINYTKCKHNLQSTLYVAEKEHYHNEIKKHQGNLSKSWCLIKSIISSKSQTLENINFIHNGKIYDKKKEIAENFNNYFINVGPSLAAKLPPIPDNPLQYMLDPEINSMFLNPTTEEEILKITLNLKDGSQGWDNLLPKIMKVTKSSWITP